MKKRWHEMKSDITENLSDIASIEWDSMSSEDHSAIIGRLSKCFGPDYWNRIHAIAEELHADAEATIGMEG